MGRQGPSVATKKEASPENNPQKNNPLVGRALQDTEAKLPSLDVIAQGAKRPAVQPAKRDRPHRLDMVRACTDPDNREPARKWNSNVHYYSNVPAEQDGLFASDATGFGTVFDLGFAHNRALSTNITSSGNYWKGLEATAKNGYRNGELTVDGAVSGTARSVASIFGSRITLLAPKKISIPFSGTQTYPAAPESLSPTHKDFKKMSAALDPAQLKARGAKIVQVHLISGYADEKQRGAWRDDSAQLDRSMKGVYGSSYQSFEYDPQRKDNTSFGAFASYLYKKADALPAGSVMVVSMFGHGNKTLEIVPSSKPGRSREGVNVGTITWGDGDIIPGFSSVERTNVNEWELRQLFNSMPQGIQVIVHGHQCLGGQMNVGERVDPKFVAPANRDK